MPELTVGAVLRDSWAVYRLLFSRAVPIAFAIYLVVDAVEVLPALTDTRDADVLLGVLALLLTFAGPLLVQGAVARIIRSVHQGDAIEDMRTLIGAAARKHSVSSCRCSSMPASSAAS